MCPEGQVNFFLLFIFLTLINKILTFPRQVKDGALYKPDQEWVQCNKCRKWRMLDPGFDTKSLPVEWYSHLYSVY